LVSLANFQAAQSGPAQESQEALEIIAGGGDARQLLRGGRRISIRFEKPNGAECLRADSISPVTFNGIWPYN
jgi:hypothetical protein